MLPLILLLIALGVVAAVAGLVRQWWYGRQVRAGIVDQMPEVRQGAAIGCCGQHEDEELDRFRGHPSSGYDAAAIEEFTDVLTTLRSEEVAGWVRSLQLRGVALPDELKDDVILLVGERRTHPAE